MTTPKKKTMKRGKKRGKQPTEGPVTPREWQVAELVIEGHHNESISNQLGISVQTVKRHMYNITHKLAVNDRLELAVKILKERHAAEMQRLRDLVGIFDLQSN